MKHQLTQSMKTVVLLLFVVFGISINLGYAQTISDDRELLTLKQWLQGSFSSEEQSKVDTSYFDVRLHIKQVWEKRKDAYWLYIEQFIAQFPDRPYRQRVYSLSRKSKDTLELKIFEIPEAIRFAGEWESKTPLKSLTPDSLLERIGCNISIVWDSTKKTFIGVAKNSICVSDIRGANYASTDLELSRESMLLWERGWTRKGQQVWGSVKGGYLFKRVKESNEKK